MRFDRRKFYEEYRKHFRSLSPQQVNGLNFILDAAEKDPFLKYVEWLAYMLATTKHETANTFQPIHEYGSRNYFIRRYGSQTAVGKRLGNDTPEEGYFYSGVGDVQLTGETNFEKAEVALRNEYPELIAEFEARTGKHFDLTVGDQPNDERDPQNAGDPAIAYAIMSFGMRTGMFTTRSLGDYINANLRDYLHCRKVINGMDKAETIAEYAKHFEIILHASYLDNEVSLPTIGIAPAPVQRIIERGMRGDDVLLVQKRLIHYAWLAPDQTDGKAGPKFEAAVIAFQQANGLPASGRVDASTRELLFREEI